MSMEFMCAWAGGKCTAMRAGKRTKSCCSGCRYDSASGCIHPDGVPEACSLWACESVVKHITQERRATMVEMAEKAFKEKKLFFREHADTKRSGKIVEVPISFYGKLFNIPAFAEDLNRETFEVCAE